MRVKQIFAPLCAVALLAAAPSPSPVPSAARTPHTVNVVCVRTPFYVFVAGSDRPMRARTPDALLGERYALVTGPRTTLEGFQFYETDVAVVEPGYPARAHYWLNRDCAIPSK